MPAKSIIIVGSGVAAWLAASLLQRALVRAQWTITVVSMTDGGDSLGLPLRADYLAPRALEQLAVLGWDETVIIRKTRAAVALGVAFTDWAGAGTQFQAVGAAGAPMGPVAFHQLAARLRLEGRAVNFANYALGALCAQANRFAPPRPDDQSVLSTLMYGLHVDAAAFAELMKQDALLGGVHHIEGDMARVERDLDGSIKHVETIDGRAVDGDLFIDCSGAGSVLSTGAARVAWGDVLPVDRVLITTQPSAGPPASFAQIAALGAGWQKFSALQSVVEEVVAFRADAMGIDAPANAVHVKPGRLVAPWRDNCVALGGAAAVTDPLLNPQLELAITATVRLINLLPASDDMHSEAREYNRQTVAELDSVCDVAAAAYALNARQEPFWESCRAQPLSERLAYKIALYRSCGRIALYDDEVYDEANWVALFEALGLRAQHYDAQANAPSLRDIDTHFSRVRQVMLDAVGTLPPHNAYLRSLSQ